MKENNDAGLDELDLRLLNHLQHDASHSNQALAEAMGVSPPTALRRVQRLKALGLIERQVALLQPQRVAALLGHGLTAVVEVSLDRQDADAQAAFENQAVAEDPVLQCYRTSPGPDFVLVVATADMPAYHALAQRLFTAHANVRHVRAFFVTHRAKFETKTPLPHGW